MDTDIICSLIQAAGTATTAIATALIARKAIKEDIKPMFQSYYDKSYDFSKVIGKARRNIVIAAASGYSFLEDHEATIRKKLGSGVCVYYLFLTEERFYEMQRYTHGEDVEDQYVNDIYSSVKNTLQELSRDYPSKVQARVFPHFITAAYVGVDIPFEASQQHTSLHSVIEVTQYQYLRAARASPITYLYPDRDKDHFTETVDSIQEMWLGSEPLPQAEQG